MADTILLIAIFGFLGGIIGALIGSVGGSFLSARWQFYHRRQSQLEEKIHEENLEI